MLPNRTRFACSVALTYGILAGCANGLHIDTEPAPRLNGAGFQTYAFADQSENGGPNWLDPVMTQAAQKALALALANKGLRLVDASQADLLILPWSSVTAPPNGSAGRYAYNGQQLADLSARSTKTTYYAQGTVTKWVLVVDVIDRTRQEIVWRGLASTKVGSRDEARLRVPTVVASIIERYPARDMSAAAR
jgi:Domain of unknown function (DUF4136)